MLATASGAAVRSRRPDRGQTRLHAPRPPRGVRHRRHGQPRTACRASPRSRCSRGYTPRETIRRRRRRRSPAAGLHVPRPRQHGDHRTLQRGCQLQGPAPQRPARLAGLAGRPHHLPDRLRQPLLGDAALGPHASSAAAAASSPTAPASTPRAPRGSSSHAPLDSQSRRAARAGAASSFRRRHARLDSTTHGRRPAHAAGERTDAAGLAAHRGLADHLRVLHRQMGT